MCNSLFFIIFRVELNLRVVKEWICYEEKFGKVEF